MILKSVEITSLNDWQKSSVNPPGPRFLVFGRFLITDSISLLVIGLFRFSILHDSNLVGIYPFSRLSPFVGI